MHPTTAYRHCEHLTHAHARNFWYGMRLLPPAKRRALSAVYSFARRVDDISDGTMAAEHRLAALEQARHDLHTIDDPGHAALVDAVLVALADAAARYPIPLAAFDELIDGCQADVLGTRYETFEDLLAYCRCVAGSIGRLSLGVFGTDDPQTAAPLADALGVALQLTNILRDVREDRLNGRIYLPADDLERFGCRLDLTDDGRLADPPDRLTALIRFEAERAHQWYDTGLALLTMLDRRSAACTAAMAGIYQRLLGRIVADPTAALSSRTSLPPWQKAVTALRAFPLASAHLKDNR